jgi:hypothetical protein
VPPVRGKQNYQERKNHMDPKVEKEFRKELKERDQRVREEMLGIPQGAFAAESMAEKARKLQAANPDMSNVQAVKAAYEAEGVPLREQ